MSSDARGETPLPATAPDAIAPGFSIHPPGIAPIAWPIAWFALACLALAPLAALTGIDPWAATAMQVPVPGLYEAGLWVSRLGSSGYLLVGLLAIVIAGRLAVRQLLWQRALFGFAAIAAAGIIVNLAKIGFGRPRPRAWLAGEAELDFAFLVWPPDSLGFPSGHSAVIGAAAAVIVAMRPRWWPWAAALALLVGASRVVVGDHFPSDVLAGLGLGALVALAVRALLIGRGWLQKG